MAWWILTFLQNIPGFDSLAVLAHTNFANHLFMSWAYYKPSRSPVYRTVRGATVLCGYKYTWDTPNISEQLQSGNTFTHSFSLPDLQPASTIWYYLWAPTGPYGAEIQGPLIHVTLGAIVLGARITRTTPFPVPNGIATPIPFEIELFDDGNFFNAALNPTRLTIPQDGRYLVGSNMQFATPVNNGMSSAIWLNGTIQICHFNHPPTIIAGWGVACLNATLHHFAAGDYLEATATHFQGAPKNILVRAQDSPIFWIQKVA